MPLAVMPRIEQLDLARVELPADHPAADLGRSVPVHGFLIEHPDGAILVDTGVQVPPRPPLPGQMPPERVFPSAYFAHVAFRV